MTYITTYYFIVSLCHLSFKQCNLKRTVRVDRNKMITYCDTCKAEIVPEDVVVSCDGICEDQRCFHARCVGLSYDEGCACLHRNIFWMCDSCSDSIERARFPMAFREKKKKREHEFATKDEVNGLKFEVNRISEMMSRIMNNCAAVTSQPSSSTPKSNNDSHLCDRLADTRSSPLSSTKIEPNSLVPAPDESIVQLYISNIAPARYRSG